MEETTKPPLLVSAYVRHAKLCELHIPLVARRDSKHWRKGDSRLSPLNDAGVEWKKKHTNRSSREKGKSRIISRGEPRCRIAEFGTSQLPTAEGRKLYSTSLLRAISEIKDLANYCMVGSKKETSCSEEMESGFREWNSFDGRFECFVEFISKIYFYQVLSTFLVV